MVAKKASAKKKVASFAELISVLNGTRQITKRLDIVSKRLDDIVNMLERSRRREREMIMEVKDIQAKADQTLEQVKSEGTVVEGVRRVVDNMNAMIAALKQQLADAIAAGADPAQLQTLSDTLDAIQQSNMANTQAVADAVAAGTTAENE